MTTLQEKQQKERNTLSSAILKILAYQQTITNQGVSYKGEKDWALNCLLKIIQSEIELAVANREKEIVENMDSILIETGGVPELALPKVINLITKNK